MSVPLVGSDTAREKAVGAIVDSMCQLIALSDNVFGQLMTRLESCSNYMSQVRAQIDRVEKKLDAVTKVRVFLCSSEALIFIPLYKPFWAFAPLNDTI